MGFSSIGTYACRALQQDILDYYGKNAPALKTMGSNALIRWLLSPQNTRGFRQITDGITQGAVPGKKKAVAFAIDQPFCFDVCAVADVDCNTVRGSLDNPTQEIVFDFDATAAYRVCDSEGNPLKLTFDKETLQKYCSKTDTQYITDQIIRFNRQFIRAFDKRVGEVLDTFIGQNANNEAVTNLPFFLNLTTGQQTLNHEAWWFLNQTYRDIGGEDQYALVGGKVLNKIIDFQKWADLSDGGIDLSKLQDINPYAYYDRYLDTTLGVNEFFLLSPGAAQLVTYTENIGENNRQVTDLYTHSTFIDPATGLEVDFEWRYDEKCKTWEYEPHLFAQLAVVPAGGCGIPNANGTLRINDCSNGATPPVCTESAS